MAQSNPLLNGQIRNKFYFGLAIWGSSGGIDQRAEAASARTTRLVDGVTTELLLKSVQSVRLKPKQLITHRFPLSDILSAYDTFAQAARERALKVILSCD